MIMINVEEIVETVASTKAPPPIGMDLDEIATEIVIEIVIGMIAEEISNLLIEATEVVIAAEVQEQIGEPQGKMSHEVAVVGDTPVMSNLNG